jgi:hypothetical protein
MSIDKTIEAIVDVIPEYEEFRTTLKQLWRLDDDDSPANYYSDEILSNMFDIFCKGRQSGAASAVKWIPVSERLPEHYGSYLVHSKFGIEILDCYSDKEIDIELAKEHDAWMPLPPPYKREDEK